MSEPTPSTLSPAMSATLAAIGSDGILSAGRVDVGQVREVRRRHRLRVIAVVLGIPTVFLWFRILSGAPVDFFRVPHFDPLLIIPVLLLVAIVVLMPAMYWSTGRSPHVLFRPEDLDVSLSDVVGIDNVKSEVVRSLNLFLAHDTFRSATGGKARRGLLFEGPPGTGKTHTAKAIAAEAGVPFLFASATSFQSSYYGATSRKIRTYFAALRRIAAREGGAIGFIDEFDAIAGTRRGMEFSGLPLAGSGSPTVAGCVAMNALPADFAAPAFATSGAPGHSIRSGFGTSDLAGPVVNELLVQLQSFDQPSFGRRALSKVLSGLNLLLPAHRAIVLPKSTAANILLIASTNRADGLDPALVRPGRFDRRITFDPPSRAGRRSLVDHFLATKVHDAELDTDARRDAIAGVTQAYTPAMLEHLFDEALISAVRRGVGSMSVADVEEARLTEEVGLGQPVGYTAHEERLIATHEAAHATMAWLVAPQRRLEVLSIIKRRSALGMLAHGDRDEVYTRGRREMLGLIQIAMGGQVAEELFFDDVSTGPSGDLLYATNVAAEMVGSCGMTDTLISYAAVQATAFNATNIVGRVLGDADGRGRVERLLQEQKATVRMLLAENMHLVAALRDALVERSELIGPDITGVLERAREEAAADAVPRVIDLRDHAGSGTPA